MSQPCLIAAHDPWLIQLLRVYTEESGFQITQAFEGQDVLAAVAKERPVAILLQLDLPGHTRGWDLPGILHGDRNSQDIPMLVFSWQGLMNPSVNIGESTIFLREPVTYQAFVEALRKVGVCCPVQGQVIEIEKIVKRYRNHPPPGAKSSSEAE